MSEVKTIGSKEVITDGQKQEELKKQKMEETAKKIAENEVKRQFRTPFLQVYNEVVNNNKTIEDLVEEVSQKKSRMTKFGRDYVTNFDPDRIRQWIEDEKKGEYYYRGKNYVG